MAVSKMKTVSITCPAEQMDSVLHACVVSHRFHAESTSELVSGVTGFTNVNEENPYRSQLSRLLEMFEEFGIEPKDAKEVPADVQSPDEFLQKLRDNLFTVQERKSGLARILEDDSETVSQLEHFRYLDIDLGKAFGCEFVKVRFGRLPADSYERLKEYEDNPNLLFVPSSAENGYYWGMYVCPTDRKEEIDRIFASLFFERLNIKQRTGTPGEALAELEKERATVEEEIARLDKQIKEYFDTEYDRCMEVYTWLKQHSDAFDLRRYCARYKDRYMLLIGWVPEEDADDTVARIKQAGAAEVTVDDGKRLSRVTPPTLLKNKKIFRPFEMYVKMYGVPRYGEFDPTAFVAITYTVLFGIMFADLGQGILLSLAGLFMWKKLNMSIGKILVPCGVASAVFGTAFGSVFGFEHWLDPMFHALGFAEKPIEVIDSAIVLLLAAVAIGVVLLILAMCLNIYSSARRRDMVSALFGPNGVAGLLLYSSAILMLLNMLLGFGIPTVVFTAAIIICVVLIFLKEPLGKLVEGKKDWKPESWGDYSLENAAELFEVVLSYFSNTISFLRVGAFVLIHAGMMLMFTKMAEAIGNPVAYAIIMVFGNIFVTVLEALLVSIQTLRLEFYEMFSRFYSGDGREYTPISADTNEN